MKPGWRDHLLGSRHWKDGEAHCMFAPILGDDGIEVACAISNKSRVSITIAHTPSPNKGDLQVTFGMGFSVNVNVKARFTSAIFCVTFQRYVDQTTLTSLNIHDLWPRDEKGEGTEVVVGAEQVVNAGFQAGTQGATLQGGLSRQHNKSYTLKTSSRVRGQGLRTPTATWTFEEDRGQAGKEGLEPEYPLHVHFSHQHADAISIKFYAEAVLMEGSKKTVLTIGNEKELFVRELILSV
ncbi:hypothetical protein BYT27DRAFT_6865190 [Phlegmacium glaucopus]|nr:hypothetical protein BYT27DRAFT_6865190 [Phlegmacium glaucopus]